MAPALRLRNDGPRPPRRFFGRRTGSGTKFGNMSAKADAWPRGLFPATRRRGSGVYAGALFKEDACVPAGAAGGAESEPAAAGASPPPAPSPAAPGPVGGDTAGQMSGPVGVGWEERADLRPERRRCDPRAVPSRRPAAGSWVSLQPHPLPRNSTRPLPPRPSPHIQNGPGDGRGKGVIGLCGMMPAYRRGQREGFRRRQ